MKTTTEELNKNPTNASTPAPGASYSTGNTPLLALEVSGDALSEKRELRFFTNTTTLSAIKDFIQYRDAREEEKAQEALRRSLDLLADGLAGARIISARNREIIDFGEGLSIEEAADFLGLTVEGLRTRIKRARRRGEWIPFFRTGDIGRGELRVSKEDLIKWGKARRFSTQA